MLGAGSSAAVVGASGFIGGAVAQALDRRGIACHRFTRATPFVVDGRVAAGLDEADVIFWLVSSIRPATAALTERAAADLDGLRTLLDLLAERTTPYRILAVSSGGTVYDTTEAPPYSESSPVRGANAYGEAMLAVEAVLRENAPDAVVLRASNAYGPGQPPRRGQGVIAHWIDAIRREEPIRIIGDLDTRRDYLYIDDLVEALLLSAFAEQVPAVLNVGSGSPTSLAELLQALRRVVGTPVQTESSPARAFDAPSTWLDITLAGEVLQWKPTISIADGLSRTWRAAVEAS